MDTKFSIGNNGKDLLLSLSITKQLERDVGDGRYNSVIGIVEKNKEVGPFEYGLSFIIDRSASGKEDSFTEYFIYLTPFMEYNDFVTICKDNGLDIEYITRK